MDYPVSERAKVAAWFEWTRDYAAVRQRFNREFGRNRTAPPLNPELKDRISEAFGQVTVEMRQKTILQFRE
ncbi:MAG: hypothetical protein GY820_24345 [Gammaproteobacteria bacterium]|nr:hypothetical protein [Gammaproteobacteria bacterium]